MRRVLRNKKTKDYWNDRWDAFEADSDTFENLELYPVKYIGPIMKKNTSTLDAGCGLGRVVKHFSANGFDIKGCDYSSVAVHKLNTSNPDLDIVEAEITNLPYSDGQFDNILAMGLFHGIESLDAIAKGIAETARCLKVGGHLVVSVMADNLENRLIDNITAKSGKAGHLFHKWCFTKKEFAAFINDSGFEINKVETVTNVPFLHKFKIFRESWNVDEMEARSNGFSLNTLGILIYGSLKLVAPNAFGTTIVYTATKN